MQNNWTNYSHDVHVCLSFKISCQFISPSCLFSNCLGRRFFRSGNLLTSSYLYLSNSDKELLIIVLILICVKEKSTQSNRTEMDSWHKWHMCWTVLFGKVVFSPEDLSHCLIVGCRISILNSIHEQIKMTRYRELHNKLIVHPSFSCSFKFKPIYLHDLGDKNINLIWNTKALMNKIIIIITDSKSENINYKDYSGNLTCRHKARIILFYNKVHKHYSIAHAK